MSCILQIQMKLLRSSVNSLSQRENHLKHDVSQKNDAGKSGDYLKSTSS